MKKKWGHEKGESHKDSALDIYLLRIYAAESLKEGGGKVSEKQLGGEKKDRKKKKDSDMPSFSSKDIERPSKRPPKNVPTHPTYHALLLYSLPPFHIKYIIILYKR